MNIRNFVRSWQWRWLLPALILGLFLAWVPSADIAVSTLFYSPTAGFYLKLNALVQLLYRSETFLTITLAVSLLAVLLLSFFPLAHWLKRSRKGAAYLLLVLAVGPGLIINFGLKNHWHRARPHQVDRFGGNRQFTAALVPSDQCERNCSFVSGHAALGFFFAAIGFPAVRRRHAWIATGVALGSTIGLARIVQGGHFLSDIVFAFCAVFVTAWILYELMYPDRQRSAGEEERRPRGGLRPEAAAVVELEHRLGAR